MASLFESPDIAALVAAFPPPLPTKNQPSLVRSHSGNGLVNSRSVLDHFRALLETEPERIKKSDLPYRLDIERSDWLLACYQGSSPIRWSANGASLIPRLVWESILEHLRARCQHEFVNLDAFAEEQDVEKVFPADLEATKELHSLQLIDCTSNPPRDSCYMTSDQLVQSIEEKINFAAQNATSEKVNLSELLPTVPLPILRQLAAGTIPQDQLEVIDTGLLLVPTDYEAAQVRMSQANHESRLQQLMERFDNDDFVIVGTKSDQSADKDVQELVSRYTGLHADVEDPTVLDVDSTTKLVAQPGLLDRTIQELKEEIDILISNNKDGLINTLDKDNKSKLASRSTEPILSDVLFSIPLYSKQLSSAVDQAISNRDHKRLEKFISEFHREITIPSELYATGIDSIQDSKLQHSLNDYVTTYFRNEAIPEFVKSSASTSSNKSTTRELQKFVERSNQAKAIVDIINAAEKFAKKMKMALPSEEERRAMRMQTLERKAFKEMPKMTRGSDVLQNLIWILLSTATEERIATNFATPNTNGDIPPLTTPAERSGSAGDGLALFMSPGKDTGRMIKQYSSIAPNEIETSNKLASWREKLKTGSETKDHLDEMRSLAQKGLNKVTSNADRYEP